MVNHIRLLIRRLREEKNVSAKLLCSIMMNPCIDVSIKERIKKYASKDKRISVSKLITDLEGCLKQHGGLPPVNKIINISIPTSAKPTPFQYNTSILDKLTQISIMDDRGDISRSLSDPTNSSVSSIRVLRNEDIKQKIGSGSFGAIYTVKDNQDIVVKIFNEPKKHYKECITHFYRHFYHLVDKTCLLPLTNPPYPTEIWVEFKKPGEPSGKPPSSHGYIMKHQNAGSLTDYIKNNINHVDEVIKYIEKKVLILFDNNSSIEKMLGLLYLDIKCDNILLHTTGNSISASIGDRDTCFIYDMNSLKPLIFDSTKTKDDTHVSTTIDLTPLYVHPFSFIHHFAVQGGGVGPEPKEFIKTIETWMNSMRTMYDTIFGMFKMLANVQFNGLKPDQIKLLNDIRCCLYCGYHDIPFSSLQDPGFNINLNEMDKSIQEYIRKVINDENHGVHNVCALLQTSDEYSLGVSISHCAYHMIYDKSSQYDKNKAIQLYMFGLKIIYDTAEKSRKKILASPTSVAIGGMMKRHTSFMISSRTNGPHVLQRPTSARKRGVPYSTTLPIQSRPPPIIKPAVTTVSQTSGIASMPQTTYFPDISAVSNSVQPNELDVLSILATTIRISDNNYTAIHHPFSGVAQYVDHMVGISKKMI